MGNRNVSRRQVLRATGAVGIGSFAVTQPASAGEREDAAVDDGAISFGWYDGEGRVANAGPLAVIDIEEAGGKHELIRNAEEYGEYICDCHEVWDEYTTPEYIAANIKWHAVDYDGYVGIVVWERVWSLNEEPPEGFYDEWGREDFDDHSDYDC